MPCVEHFCVDQHLSQFWQQASMYKCMHFLIEREQVNVWDVDVHRIVQYLRHLSHFTVYLFLDWFVLGNAPIAYCSDRGATHCSKSSLNPIQKLVSVSLTKSQKNVSKFHTKFHTNRK